VRDNDVEYLMCEELFFFDDIHHILIHISLTRLMPSSMLSICFYLFFLSIRFVAFKFWFYQENKYKINNYVDVFILGVYRRTPKDAHQIQPSQSASNNSKQHLPPSGTDRSSSARATKK